MNASSQADTLPATVGAALQAAAARLARSSPTPRLDAEVLLRQVCGLNRTGLLTADERRLTSREARDYATLIRRRANGEPVAYLTGTREFWSLPVAVTPTTLIPRPDTELLVERALALVPADAAWHIADLGTGSGAIALALAHERPHCRLIATDVSESALAVARANAQRLDLPNIAFRGGDWFDALDEACVDLIVSNPPYVAEDDVHLQRGDVRFEPRPALAAGPDGLTALRVLIAGANRHLAPGGWLLLEHGFDQAPAVAALLQEAGYRELAAYRDLAGHPRVSVGRRD